MPGVESASHQEVLFVFKQFFKLVPSSPTTLLPSQDNLGCPVQRPTRHPTGTLLLLIGTHSHVHLSAKLGCLLATPTTCQPSNHTSSQPVGAIMTVPMGYLSLQPTVLMLAEPVGTGTAPPTSLLSHWRPSRPFSRLTCLPVMLPLIQLNPAVTLLLSY